MNLFRFEMFAKKLEHVVYRSFLFGLFHPISFNFILMASCVEARNVLKSVFLEQYRSFQQRRLTRAVMADERPWRSQVDSHFFLLIDSPTKFLSDRPLTFHVCIWHAGASSDYVLHFSNLLIVIIIIDHRLRGST